MTPEPLRFVRSSVDALGRRDLLCLAGSAGLAALSGCAGSSDDGAKADADVIAGPGGDLAFDPEEIAITVGESLVWFFDTPGHNVSGRPGDSDAIELPAGADPFSSYGPDEPPLGTEGRGETYEHTFETPGTYVYVCIPHTSAGMIGRVTVGE